MKATKVISYVIVFLLLKSYVLLGSDTTIPLKVGDKVPDIFWNTVVNYNKNSVRLSDFRGKKIIIDVWHRWCGTCIAGFPYVEKIQEKYGGQLVILTVTSDKLEDFSAAKKRSKIIQESKLPFIVNDSEMVKFMKPGFYPFYAWIDEQGILVATTGWSGLTEERVRSFIHGNNIGVDYGAVHWETEATDVDKMYRIHERKREFEGILYYSSFEKEGSKTLSPITRAIKYSLPGEGVQILDHTLLQLFTGAFQTQHRDIITFDPSLKELLYPADEKDKERIEEWENSNVYSYQIRFPPESLAKVDRERTSLFIQYDLQDFTGIKAEKKKVEREVFVLTRKDSVKIFSRPADTVVSITERTRRGIFIQNGDMDSFSNILAAVLNTGRIEYIPLINETGITGAVNIDIVLGPYVSEERINKLLKPYGLSVRKQRRQLESLVLSR